MDSGVFCGSLFKYSKCSSQNLGVFLEVLLTELGKINQVKSMKNCPTFHPPPSRSLNMIISPPSVKNIHPCVVCTVLYSCVQYRSAQLCILHISATYFYLVFFLLTNDGLKD